MTGRIYIALVASCWLAAAGAAAAERKHTVRDGESASAIAKRYYGSYDLADLLLRFNGRSGTTIRPGEDLRVPICDVHTVRSGDSWSKLAQRYLDRAGAWREIAVLNGIDPKQSLRIGQRIVIPVILPQELRKGESLGVLAKRFYGGVELLPVLQSFNGIDDPRRLSVGQKIEVPLVAFRAKAGSEPAKPPAPKAKPKAAPKTKPKPKPKSPVPQSRPKQEPVKIVAKPAPRTPEPAPNFGRLIRAAAVALDQDDYEGARAVLERLRERVTAHGNDSQKAELLRLFALVYVAYDMPEKACAAHRSRARIVKPAPLDPDLVSPKIREALDRCDETGS